MIGRFGAAAPTGARVLRIGRPNLMGPGRRVNRPRLRVNPPARPADADVVNTAGGTTATKSIFDAAKLSGPGRCVR